MSVVSDWTPEDDDCAPLGAMLLEIDAWYTAWWDAHLGDCASELERLVREYQEVDEVLCDCDAVSAAEGPLPHPSPEATLPESPPAACSAEEVPPPPLSAAVLLSGRDLEDAFRPVIPCRSPQPSILATPIPHPVPS